MTVSKEYERQNHPLILLFRIDQIQHHQQLSYYFKFHLYDLSLSRETEKLKRQSTWGIKKKETVISEGGRNRRLI